jgi:hypothetical protein
VVPKPFDVEVLQALVRRCAGVSPQSSGGVILSGGMLLLLADLLK